MTDAEFRAYVADARAEAQRRLAELDQIDGATLDDAGRAEIATVRQGIIDLLASLSDEALAAELAATEYAGRDLTPDEVSAIRRRQ